MGKHTDIGVFDKGHLGNSEAGRLLTCYCCERLCKVFEGRQKTTRRGEVVRLRLIKERGGRKIARCVKQNRLRSAADLKKGSILVQAQMFFGAHRWRTFPLLLMSYPTPITSSSMITVCVTRPESCYSGLRSTWIH